MQENNFYQNLKAINSLKDISKDDTYVDYSKKWFVIVTDIKGSTKAIDSGKYKEVNMIGALSIISIINLNREVDIPFVFGGDGAFILIPPSLYDRSMQALLHIKKLALESYELDLRVGIIPVEDVYTNGKKLLVTKYRVSTDYFQVIIKGGGLDFCDLALKSNDKYTIKEKINENFELDLSGLECRWNNIPTPKDTTLSIIIKAFDDKEYGQIFENIENIIGNSKQRHPISEDKMSLSFDSKKLNVESSLYDNNNFFTKMITIFTFKCINLIGNLLIYFKVDKWSSYKNRIVATTDTEKFDDTLRMTVSTSFNQLDELAYYLEEECKKKKLLYGLHKSDSSLMTCFIFERHGKHIHFVDTANGGYAMAAKMMKKQVY